MVRWVAASLSHQQPSQVSALVVTLLHRGARCSSVVRAFAHGAMGRCESLSPATQSGERSRSHATSQRSDYESAHLTGLLVRETRSDPSHHERTLLPRSYISLLCEVAWLRERSPDWVAGERDSQRPIAPWANALTTELHLAPLWSSVTTRALTWLGCWWERLAATHRTMSERSYHGATSRSSVK